MSVGDSYVTTFEMDVVGDSETKGKLDQLAGRVKNVGDQGEQAAKKTSRFTSTMKGSALGITAAASSATALYFQYDNLQKGSLRVQEAQKTLTSAQASLASAQNSVNRLVEKGVNVGPEYEAATLRLKSAQEQLAISQEKEERSLQARGVNGRSMPQARQTPIEYSLGLPQFKQVSIVGAIMLYYHVHCLIPLG